MSENDKLGEYWFPGVFTTLNKVNNQNRAHWSRGAKTKKAETSGIYYDLIGAIPVTEYPVFIEFHWRVVDERTDPDNIAFCKKVILDGMVDARVLEGDSWKFCSGGFRDFFKVDPKNPGVIVVVRRAVED